MKQSIHRVILLLLITILCVSYTAAWADTDYGTRIQLAFNNSNSNENLDNFTVLVQLNASRVSYDSILDAGEDITFYDADGTTELPYEIELWNESGTSYIWVRVPRITASSQTDHIWMYYDNVSYTRSILNLYNGSFTFSKNAESTASTGLDYNGSHFFVLEGTGQRVYRYNSSGDHDGFNFSVSSMTDPQSIRWYDNQYHVLDGTDNNVTIFNASGSFVVSYSLASAGEIYGFDFNGTHYHVTDYAGNLVIEYTDDGTWTGNNFSIAPYSTGSSSVQYHEGNYYVSDYDNGYVYEFYNNGTHSGINFSTRVGASSLEDIAFNGSHFYDVGAAVTNISEYIANWSQHASKENASAVWEDQWQGVWHMNNNSVNDSTENDLHGNATSGCCTLDNGQIGGGLRFDGSSEYINFGDQSLLEPYNGSTQGYGNLSISMWINVDDYSSTITLFEKRNNVTYVQYGTAMGSNYVEGVYIENEASSRRDEDAATDIGTGNWELITWVFNEESDNITIYFNNTEVTASPLTNSTGASWPTVDNSEELWFGAQNDGGGQYYFDGIADELRISRRALSQDWIEAEYLSGTDQLLTYGAQETNTWANESFSFRIKLTINNSESTEDLIDFPHLVVLNGSRINYQFTQDNGEDIRFYDSDQTTALAYEIEKWNETNHSYVWVKVPQIDALSTTDHIWMYFGNKTVSDGQNATAVWTNNYVSVWHMGQTSEPMPDSTITGNNLTLQSTPDRAYPGIVDGAMDFIGNNEYLTMDSEPATRNRNFTISLWANPDTITGTGGGGQGLMRSANAETIGDWVISLQSTSAINFYYWENNGTDTDGRLQTTATPISNNTWHHITAMWNGSNRSIYVNGTRYSGARSSTFSGWGSGDEIGRNFPSDALYHDGTIDEVRISNVTRSDEWINATYLSMTDAMNTVGSTQYLANVCINETGICWTNITDAVSNATAGQTVIITNSNQYNESVTINKTLTITSSGSAYPTIYGNNVSAIIEENNVTITIRKVHIITNGTANSIAGIYLTEGNITVEDATVTVDLTGSSTGAIIDPTVSSTNALNWNLNRVNITSTNSDAPLWLEYNVNTSTSYVLNNSRVVGTSVNATVWVPNASAQNIYIQNTDINQTGTGGNAGAVVMYGGNVINTTVYSYSLDDAFETRSGNLTIEDSTLSGENDVLIIGSSGETSNITLARTNITAVNDTFSAIWAGSSSGADSVTLTASNTTLQGTYPIFIDASATTTGQRTITLTNTNLLPTNTTFEGFGSGENANVSFNSLLDVYVNDTSNNPVNGATVTANNVSGTQIASTTTGSNGRIPQQTILYARVINNGTTNTTEWHTNHTVNASHPQYTAATAQNVNMSQSRLLNFTIEALSVCIQETEICWTNITDAVNNATAGQTIVITDNRTYSNSQSWSSNLTITSNGTQYPILATLNASGIVNTAALNVSRMKFLMTGTQDNVYAIRGSAQLYVKDVEINITTNGSGVRGIYHSYFAETSPLHIEQVNVSANSTNADHIEVYVDGADLFINNTRHTGNGTNAIQSTLNMTGGTPTGIVQNVYVFMENASGAAVDIGGSGYDVDNINITAATGSGMLIGNSSRVTNVRVNVTGASTIALQAFGPENVLIDRADLNATGYCILTYLQYNSTNVTYQNINGTGCGDAMGVTHENPFNSNTTFLNTTADPADILFTGCGTCNVSHQKYLDVYVNDSRGNAVDAVTVRAINANSLQEWNVSTNSTGRVPVQGTEYAYQNNTGSTTTTYTDNHTIVASKNGYQEKNVSVNVSTSQFLNMTLEASVCVQETQECWTTIQEAVDNATAGQTVVITDNQTYDENITILTNLTLTSNGSSYPLILKTNITGIQFSGVNASIEKVRLNITGSTSAQSALRVAGFSSLIVSDVDIYTYLNGTTGSPAPIKVLGGSSIELNRVNITSDMHDRYIDAGNANTEVIVNNSRLEGYQAGGSTFALNILNSGEKYFENTVINFTSGSGLSVYCRGDTYCTFKNVTAYINNFMRLQNQNFLFENSYIESSSSKVLEFGFGTTNVLIKNTELSGSGTCVEDVSSENSNIVYENVIMTDCNPIDFNAGGSGNVLNHTVYNTTNFNFSNNLFSCSSNECYVTYYNYLDIVVNDTNGNYVSNANVTVRNVSGTLIESENTNITGSITQKNVSFLEQYNNGTLYENWYTNHTINASHPQYGPATAQNVNMSSSRVLNFTLGASTVCVQETQECWYTIQDAIDNATTGQTVVITTNQTYNENLSFSSSGLTLTSNSSGRPMIAAADTEVIHLYSHTGTTTIANVNINATGDSTVGITEDLFGENISIANVTVYVNSTGGNSYGVYTQFSTTYADNLVVNSYNSTTPVETNFGPWILNNSIINDTSNESTYAFRDNAGVDVPTHTFENSVIVGGTTDAIRFEYAGYTTLTNVTVRGVGDSTTNGILPMSNLTIIDSDITATGSALRSIFAPANITIIGSNVQGGGANSDIYLSPNNDYPNTEWYVYNTTVDTLELDDFSGHAISPIFVFVNTTMQPEAITYTNFGSDDGSTINLSNYLDVYVNDTNGNAISGVTVTVDNVTGNQIISTTTSGTGRISSQEVLFANQSWNGSEIVTVWRTNHTVNVSHIQYKPGTTQNTNMSSNRLLNFTLELGGVCVEETQECWSTIQDAVDNATTGQTVVITDNATYTENVVVNKSISIIENASIGYPTIHSTDGTAVQITVTNVAIDGINVSAMGTLATSRALDVQNDGFNFTNGYVWYNETNTSIELEAVFLNDVNNIYFSNVDIYNINYWPYTVTTNFGGTNTTFTDINFYGEAKQAWDIGGDNLTLSNLYMETAAAWDTFVVDWNNVLIEHIVINRTGNETSQDLITAGENITINNASTVGNASGAVRFNGRHTVVMNSDFNTNEAMSLYGGSPALTITNTSFTTRIIAGYYIDINGADGVRSFNITLINSTILPNETTYTAMVGGDEANITFISHLDVRTEDISGNPLSGATVQARNSSNELVMNESTTGSGSIATQLITYAVQNATGTTTPSEYWSTNHTINASVSGYDENTTTRNMSTYQNITLILAPADVSYNTCTPDVGDHLVVNIPLSCSHVNMTVATINISSIFTTTNVSIVSEDITIFQGGGFAYTDSPTTTWLNGNLTVNGNYTLDNATLRVNGSTDGEYQIFVNGTGLFTMGNGSNVSNGETGAANYIFIVNGTINASESFIEKVGWQFGLNGDDGILINGVGDFDEMNIESDWGGIISYGTLTIDASNFTGFGPVTSSEIGLWTVAGTLLLENSVFENFSYAVHSDEGSSQTIRHNTFYDPYAHDAATITEFSNNTITYDGALSNVGAITIENLNGFTIDNTSITVTSSNTSAISLQSTTGGTGVNFSNLYIETAGYAILQNETNPEVGHRFEHIVINATGNVPAVEFARAGSEDLVFENVTVYANGSNIDIFRFNDTNDTTLDVEIYTTGQWVTAIHANNTERFTVEDSQFNATSAGFYAITMQETTEDVIVQRSNFYSSASVNQSFIHFPSTGSTLVNATLHNLVIDHDGSSGGGILFGLPSYLDADGLEINEIVSTPSSGNAITFTVTSTDSIIINNSQLYGRGTFFDVSGTIDSLTIQNTLINGTVQGVQYAFASGVRIPDLNYFNVTLDSSGANVIQYLSGTNQQVVVDVVDSTFFDTIFLDTGSGAPASSHNFTISNSSITDITADDANAEFVVILENTTYTSLDQTNCDGTPDCVYRVRWYVDVYVNDTIGDALSGATVTFDNVTGTQVRSDTTATTGFIGNALVTSFELSNNVEYWATNYTIEASATGYANSNLSVNFTDNAIYNLTLTAGTPEISGAVLNATDNPRNETTANLTAYYQNAQNATTFAYNWKLNGNSINLLNVPFDEYVMNTTNEAIADFSDNASNLTLSNGSGLIYAPQWVENGVSGGAYYFNGTTGLMSCTDAFCGAGNLDMGTRDFTISAWVNVSPTAGAGMIVSKAAFVGGSNPDGYSFQILNNGQVFAAIHNNPSSTVYSSNDGGIVNDSTWHHVVVSFDRDGNMTRYIDGVQTGTADDISALDGLDIDNGFSFRIGSRNVEASPIYFNGTIDEVQVFDRVLSTEQIASLYNSGTPRNNLTVSQETSLGDNWSVDITPMSKYGIGATVSSNDLEITQRAFCIVENETCYDTLNAAYADITDGWHVMIRNSGPFTENLEITGKNINITSNSSVYPTFNIDNVSAFSTDQRLNVSKLIINFVSTNSSARVFNANSGSSQKILTDIEVNAEQNASAELWFAGSTDGGYTHRLNLTSTGDGSSGLLFPTQPINWSYVRISTEVPSVSTLLTTGTGAANSYIEHSYINVTSAGFSFDQDNLTIINTTIHGNYAGLSYAGTIIRDSTLIANTTGGGVAVWSVDNGTLFDNVVLKSGQYGLLVQDGFLRSNYTNATFRSVSVDREVLIDTNVASTATGNLTFVDGNVSPSETTSANMDGADEVFVNFATNVTFYVNSSAGGAISGATINITDNGSVWRGTETTSGSGLAYNDVIYVTETFNATNPVGGTPEYFSNHSIRVTAPGHVSATTSVNASETSVLNVTLTAFQCGLTLTEDTTLTENLSTTGSSCLTIGTDNITLDCNGFTIDGDDTANTVGILAESVENVTIQNCVVQDFIYGIYVNNSNISSVHSNVLTTRHGISIDDGNNNSAWNNTIAIDATSFDDTPYDISGTSTYNTFDNSTANSSSRYHLVISSGSTLNSFRNITWNDPGRVDFIANNSIDNISTMHGQPVYAFSESNFDPDNTCRSLNNLEFGFLYVDCDDLSFNNITSNGTSSLNTMHFFTANNITLTNITITNLTGSGVSGVHLENSNNFRISEYYQTGEFAIGGASNVNITNGEIENFVVSSGSSMNIVNVNLTGEAPIFVNFNGGNDNVFENVTINQTEPPISTASYIINWTFRNVSFNRSEFVADTENVNLTIEWFLDVNVTYANGTPVNGASVSITNSSGTSFYAGTTGANGRIPQQSLKEYLWNNSNFTEYQTPYTVNVSLTGYVPQSRSVNLTYSREESFTLGLANVCVQETQECFTTIQEAFDNATAGQTLVIVNEGTYAEGIDITKAINITSNSTNLPLIQGPSGSGFAFRIGANLTLTNLNLSSDGSAEIIEYNGVYTVNVSNSSFYANTTANAVDEVTMDNVVLDMRNVDVVIEQVGIVPFDLNNATIYWHNVNVTDVGADTFTYLVDATGTEHRHFENVYVNLSNAVTTGFHLSHANFANLTYHQQSDGEGIDAYFNVTINDSTIISPDSALELSVQAWTYVYRTRLESSESDANEGCISYAENRESRNLTVVDSTIAGSCTFPVVISQPSGSGNQVTFDFINVTGIAPGEAGYNSCSNDQCEVNLISYLDVYVQNETTALNGVGVTVVDSLSNTDASVTTAGSGYIARQNITYVNETNGAVTWKSNHTVTASLVTYGINSTSINLSTYQFVNLTLYFQGTVCVQETQECFSTIQAAVDNATTGQTVVITDDSVYNENVTVNTAVHITSNGTSLPTVTYNESAVFDISVGYVNISKLQIIIQHNGTSSEAIRYDGSVGFFNVTDAVIYINGSGNRGIYVLGDDNVYFENISVYGLRDGRAFYSEGSTNVTLNNFFINMSVVESDPAFTSIVFGAPAGGTTIINNSDIYVYSGNGNRHSIGLEENAIIENTNIWNNDTEGWGIFPSGGAPRNDWVLRNITINQSGGAPFAYAIIYEGENFLLADSIVSADTQIIAFDSPTHNATIVNTTFADGSVPLYINVNGAANGSINLTVINSTANPENTDYVGCGGVAANCNVTFMNWLDITVVDQASVGIVDAIVNVTDGFNTTVFVVNTTTGGVVAIRNITYAEQTYNGSDTNTTYYNNFTVRATKDIITTSEIINLSTSQDLTLMLFVGEFTVRIESESGGNSTADVLNAVATGANGSRVVYDWALNGTSIALMNYPFDINVSGVTADAVRDYAGDDHNLTLGNGTAADAPTWTTEGILGGAYSFNGTTYLYDDPTDIALNEITVSTWLNVTDTEDRSAISSDNGLGDPDTWHIFAKGGGSCSGQYAIRTENSTSGFNQLCVGEVYVEKWTHIAFTYNGSEIRGYQNGTLQNTDNLTDFSPRIEEILVGDGPQFPWNGTIDEVTIYNRTLTAEQIAAIYNGGSPSYDEIVPQETYVGDNWSVTAYRVNASEQIDYNYSTNMTILDVLSCSWVNAETCPAGQERFLGAWNGTYGYNNAQAQLGNYSGPGSIYNQSLCCSTTVDPGFSTSCTDETVLGLSDTTNAQVQNGTINTYSEDACLAFPTFNLECSYKAACDNTESCVLSISNDTNAHVGECGHYTIDVCCTYSNGPPTRPTQLEPSNGNTTVFSRYPYFDWTTSTDLEGDDISYELDIDAPVSCTALPVYTVTPSAYQTVSELCTDETYQWRVRACDNNSACSPWSDTWTFEIASVVDITLVTDAVEFGLMPPSTNFVTEENDTLNNDPAPFVVNNTGNVRINLSLRGLDDLWTNSNLGNDTFQFADEDSSSWENVTLNYQLITSSLLYNDTREVEIRIESPIFEPDGVKDSTVQILGASVE